jgi:hypothetical protein
MEQELEPGTTNHRFFENELLTVKQIANYFGLKARRMRQQQPQCFDEPNTVACSTTDGQHTTSEGEEEREYSEDPMFISVEDELIELVKETGVIEEQAPPPTPPPPLATYEPTIPPVSLTTHKHRHDHHKKDEIFVK